MQKRSGSEIRRIVGGSTERDLPIPRGLAMNALGPVLYAARLSDGVIKLGFTTQLGDRLRYLKKYTGLEVELLAVRPGTVEDEQQMNAHLVAYVARGREYYVPSTEVLGVVNAMRADLDLPTLVA